MLTGSVVVTVVVVPLGPGGACFGFRGDYLFLGTSTRVVELAASPQTPKLSSAASFKDALGMGSSPVGVLAYNHVALIEAFGPMVPRGLTSALDGLGLRNTDLLVMRLGAKGRALVGTGSVQARGEWQGLMKALVSTQVDKSLLKLAPRDAAIAWASNMSLEDLYAGVLGLINAIDAGGGLGIGIEQNMAAFQARVGVDIQKDIFGSLGRGTVVTTSATSALPALIISCTLKDGDRLERGLTKLVAELDAYIKLVNDPPAGAALKTLTFGQHTIRYLATPGVPVPLAPCYVRTQDRLLLAMSPIHMKDYLLFLDKGEPSVLDNPGFQELAALVPDNAMSIGYSNVGESFVEMYGLLGPLLTLAHGIPNNPLAVDFANLPSKRTVRKHMFGSISYTYATRNRLVYECQSPFGVPFIGAAPAGLPAVAVGGVMAGMLLPALARARNEARLVRDRNNLNMLGKGFFTYLNDHGENRFYPRSIAELWDKEVLPDRQIFVSPLDRAPPKLPNGLACSYESCFDRHPNRIFRDDFPPNVICAWDRVPFVRGRRNVLFFDSHVEAMGEMRFQELLRQLDEAAGKLKERPVKRGKF